MQGWEQPVSEPVVISGSAERDAAAYAESGQELTEADWRVLERVAPRPIWERIEEAHKRLSRAEAVSSRPAESPSRESAVTVSALHPQTRLVTEHPLPDGNVRIIYELQHYGGTASASATDGGTSRVSIKLTGADLKPIEALLAKQLGGAGTVVALPTENKVVVTCPASARDQVISLLDSVDQPARQAEITARIFEVSHDFDFQLGAQALIKHLSGDNKQAFASALSPKAFAGAVTDPIAGTVPDPGAALRLIQVFEAAGLTVDVTFQALAETGLIRVVSSPRMTVASGQTARMLAGQELPIQSARISNDKFISETITYKPVGVQLYITPQVIGRNDVKLHVVTVVSAVSGFAPLPNMEDGMPGDTIINPIIDSREAETYVTVSDGSTLVIGGLRMIRTVTREAKVPGLGDLQVIEWLFKSHRSQKIVNDLYFFVTPRIIG